MISTGSSNAVWPAADVCGTVDVGPGVRVAVLQDPDGNAIEVVDGAP
ncbi:VOC family protein [Streptomyces mirabilis]